MIDRIADALVGAWLWVAEWWADRHLKCICLPPRYVYHERDFHWENVPPRPNPECPKHGLSWP